jgi:hypothetical protein
MSTTKSTADQVDAIIGTAFRRSDEIIAKKKAALKALEADIKAAEEARDAYRKKGDVAKAEEVEEAKAKAEQALENAKTTTDADPTTAATKATDIADTAAETLRRELKVVSDNVADWGFGSERGDNGQVKALPGTWAHWVTDTVSAHQVTLHGPDGKSGLVKDVADAKTAAQQALEAANAAKTTAEQAPAQNGPAYGRAFWGVVLLCTVLGGVLGLIAGYLFLMTGVPGFGPVTGLLLGLVIGLITGYLIANMRTNNAQKKGEQ